jgi:glucose/arabinose dehydrogenase
MRFILVLSLCARALFSYAQLPTGFIKYEIAGGLNPTDMALSPDGRVFITEKDGLVRIVQNGVLLPDPFVILQEVESFNEQGLGHIALHPGFPDQPYIYVYYTVADSNGLSHNRLSRITANGNFAVPGSEIVLYECDSSFGTVHHGGDILFGSDGKLYLSTGDKGRFEKVQSLDSDLGKVLRLNSDGSIPADNPWFNEIPGKYRAIYALGFRNPYSMAVQPGTGRIYISDVGGALWEEVNELLSGKNYGWPLLEGRKTSQSVPSNYQDPLHAYDHNAGCSIIGAAFTPTSGTNLPLQFQGRFLFADYCQGYIKAMDPIPYPGITTFATAIDRPVALAVTTSGDLYYLARAGIGGGSFQDNTESENGSLWKVVYTGSEAPFVYAQPHGALLHEGEPFSISVKALGRTPLRYQWQKNGLDLPAPDSSSYTIAVTSLADSGAVYRCVVSNALGTDTSGIAMLRITTNKRPELEIILPDSSFLYKAGAEIPFSGRATDPETGIMPASMTAWKVDLHHDEHLHPVMTPTAGLDEETIFVPTVGEADDNVWYRFHFSATDNAGLTQSVHRDVHPQKTVIAAISGEPGIPVDADGFFGNTPYYFKSVTGLKRSLRVTGFLEREDSVLIFKKWWNGSTGLLWQFQTPDADSFTVRVDYEKVPKAGGFGLLGNYYRENYQPWGFDEPLLFSRIDSFINYEWLEGSPAPGYVPLDGFTTAWTGTVTPYETDYYTFYTLTDDGARLWVADSLLIDHWQPQGSTEYEGRIFLEAGKRYPVRFEYLELGGGATAKLMWSTLLMPKQVIPACQLHPPKHLIPNTVTGSVWLDTDNDGLFSEHDLPLARTTILLLDSLTGEVVRAGSTDGEGVFVIRSVPTGSYRLQISTSPDAGYPKPAPPLSPAGISPVFRLGGDESANWSLRFLEGDTPPVPWAESAWDISPNPGSGMIVFRKKVVAYRDRFHIRVFNTEGKLCLEKILPENTWETILDLTGLQSGVYVIRAGLQAKEVIIRN